MIVECWPKVPQRGSQKRKTADFCVNGISLVESLLQNFFVWKLSAAKLKVLTVLTSRAKMIGGGDPFYLKFWIKLTALERNRRFSILFFARSDSAVTPSEKSSINTNTMRFPMSPRWTSYVVSKPPKGGSKTQSVRNLNNKLR